MARIDVGFSARLINLRKQRGMSQLALANALGIQRTTVSGYEIEGKEPDYGTLVKIANYFSVTIDYLLGRNPEMEYTDVVFFNDANHFRDNFQKLPPDQRGVVEQIFDRFYVTLHRDIVTQNKDALDRFNALMGAICDNRSSIRRTIDDVAAGLLPFDTLCSLIEKVSQMKNDVSSAIDKMVELDLNQSSR